MPVADDQLLASGPWPQGLNNLAQEGALPTDEDGRRIAVREAVNVDLSREGIVRRRDGYRLIASGSLIHSGWSRKGMPYALFVDDGQLVAMFPSGEVQPLGMDVGNLPLSYGVAGGNVYFSSRATGGMVTPDLEVHPWAPEQPAGQPAAVAVAGFGLNPGQYQVAITFTDGLGRESGTTLAAVVDVPEQGGIELSNIPQPLVSTSIGVYLTDANDQVLRRYASLPPGTTELLIGQPPQGRSLQTQRLMPLPAGQWVAFYNGRQYVAAGRQLLWSPALRYGMTDPARNVIVFDADIDMLVPIGDGSDGGGLFVAAGERTYFLAGPTPEAFNRRFVSGQGAVPGSAIIIDGSVIGADTADQVALWLSKGGQFCTGMAGGSVAPINRGMYAVDAAERAAPLLRGGQGGESLVMALRGARPQGLAVTDKAVAHVLYRAP